MEGKEAGVGMQEEAPKKRIPLESLSKDELIKKYKNLLVIAQKAKEAKDEANEEVKAMKEKLNVLQTNSKTHEKNDSEISKENQLEKQLNAMQEMISNLTDQKLQFAMEMDGIKKKTVKLEEELSQMKVKEGKLKSRVNELETERDGFERQARRLEKEAESLSLALDETERQGSEALLAAQSEKEELKKELDSLMSKSGSSPESSPGTESFLKKQLETQKEKYSSLQKEITLFISLTKGDGQGSQAENSLKSLMSAWNAFTDLQKHCSKIKQEVDRLKRVEEEKDVVVEEIEKLKEQVNIGVIAQNQLRELNEDREVLASQVQSLKAALSVYNECKEKLMAVEIEKEDLAFKLAELQCADESQKDFQRLLAEAEGERESLRSQLANFHELKAQLDSSEKEKLELTERVRELQDGVPDAKECEEKLALALSENSSLLNNISTLKEESASCQDELSRLKVQCKAFEDKISGLEAECDQVKTCLTQTLQENEKLLNEVKSCEQMIEESRGYKDRYLETLEEKNMLEKKIENLNSSLAKDNAEREQLLKITTERDDFLKQVKMLQKENENQKETKDKLNAVEAENGSLKLRVEELEKSREDLKSQISLSQKEAENLNEQLKALQDAMEMHRVYKDTTEAEKQALSLENGSLREANNLAAEEREKLKKEVQGLKSKLEKKTSREERLTEIESDRQAVIVELERLRLMLSESEGARDDLRNQNERLKGMLASLEERLRASEEGAEGVREALENKVNSLQSALREKEALESELSTLRETLARAEELMRDVEDGKNVLEGENRSLRESLKEQNKLLERLQEVEEGKDGMEREIEALRASLKEESSLKARLEVEKQSLEKEVTALRMTVKEEDKVMERLKEVEEEKDAMEREIEALRITLKDESKVREVLRMEKEEKEGLEKELEALKVTLMAEAKVRENLRLAVERSSMLEREVEDLKLTLKEESKVREKLDEVMTQKDSLEKEVQSLKGSWAEVSGLEEGMKRVLEEKERLSDTQKELLNQNELFKRQIQSAEEEKGALELNMQEIEGLMGKWRELLKNLISTNALDKILVSAEAAGGKSSEEGDPISSKDVKSRLAEEVENFRSLFKSKSNERHFVQRVHQVLEAAIMELNQVNFKSEEVVNRFKKLDDERCKVKKDMEKKLLRLKSQNEEFRKKESEKAVMSKEVDAIREVIGLKPYSGDVTNLGEALGEVVPNLRKQLQELTEERKRLEEVVGSYENEVKAAKEVAIELEKKVKELEEAKSSAEQQLISEMKGANTVLKKRGEAIASLQAEIGKLSSQLLEEQKAKKEAVAANQGEAMKEDESNQSSSFHQTKMSYKKFEELEEECKSLRSRISDLEKQINLQNSRGVGASDGVGSEVLSTSTISKVEEMSRLKDVEESFEDRYTKLRSVAVKLKRRCTELEGERKRADELQCRVNNLTKELSNLSLQAKNAQSLQLECDRLQDKVDELVKENNMSKKALKESVDECAAYKIQVQEYREERNHVNNSLECVTKEKSALETGLREANLRALSMRKEADSEVSQRKNAEKEVHRLEQELNAAKARISQEEAKCADALKQLEVGKQTWKRGNVLSLEMDALEQSAADLRRQLEESREEASKLKESLSQAEKELENSKQKEEEAQLNKEMLKETKTKLLEIEKLKNEADENVERLRREVETQSLQLVKSMAEAKRQADSYRTQQEAVLAQASFLEGQVTRLRTELIERKTELEQVRSDFAAYKVRAQAVLLRKEKEREAESGGAGSRRDKEEEEAKQMEWDRERQQLERTSDGLRRTLEDVTSQLEQVRAERESMEEKCHVLDSECHRLRELSRQIEEQHREEARQARLQSDTLIRSYKQQLEDLQERYRSETLSLREQLQKLKDEKEQAAVQQSTVETVKRSRSSDEHSRSSNTHAMPWALATEGTLAPLDGRSTTEMALHPREEGEGSESVDSPPSPHSTYNSRSSGKIGVGGRRKKKGLLPLDQLLSSSSLPDEEETDGADHDTLQGDEEENSVGDWVSGHRSSSGMVAALERRSKHLSLLLSEAESEGARLAQQNALLKEEVRRLERSAERTEHAHNAEYLKNVLIKFITLQGGDERCRLVPVLTTILKLSPEETSQLNTVASGGVLDSSHGAGANRGWGSYLHLWPTAP